MVHMYCISYCCSLHFELCTLVRCLQKIRFNPCTLGIIINHWAWSVNLQDGGHWKLCRWSWNCMCHVRVGTLDLTVGRYCCGSFLLLFQLFFPLPRTLTFTLLELAQKMQSINEWTFYLSMWRWHSFIRIDTEGLPGLGRECSFYIGSSLHYSKWEWLTCMQNLTLQVSYMYP